MVLQSDGQAGHPYHASRNGATCAQSKGRGKWGLGDWGHDWGQVLYQWGQVLYRAFSVQAIKQLPQVAEL